MSIPQSIFNRSLNYNDKNQDYVPEYCLGLFGWECQIGSKSHYGTALTPEEAEAGVRDWIIGEKNATCKITENVAYATKDEMSVCRNYALRAPNLFKDWFADSKKGVQFAEKPKEKVESDFSGLPADLTFKSGKYGYMSYIEWPHVSYVRVNKISAQKGIWKVNVDTDEIPEIILVVGDDGKVFSVKFIDLALELSRTDMEGSLIDNLKMVLDMLQYLPGIEMVSKEEFDKAYRTANTVSFSTI
ncbi:MAG: hypothetical protein HYY43_01285 [Deltaproteobacteria bacterium]|nr:hypothetical protein [Deltaproteobacteria bacterium]